MHSFKILRLAAAISTSLALSACGGGGGSSSSPSLKLNTDTASSQSQQHWLPYYKMTVLDTDEVSTVDHLSLASISAPATHGLVAGHNVTLMTNESGGSLGRGYDRRYAGSRMVFQDANGAFGVNGTRYFFYLSNGNLYQLDLTTTDQPTPTNLGNLVGLTQLCSIKSAQSDLSGENGHVVITGATTPGAGPSDCSSTTSNLSTWVAPYSGSPSNVGFYENVIAAYVNGSTVATHLYEGADRSLYITNNLTLSGTQVKDENNAPIGSASTYVTLIGQGDVHHYYAVTDTYQGGTTASTLYSVADDGTAKTTISVPYIFGRGNVDIDKAGSIYWTVITPPASGQTTGLITVYKSTLTGTVTTLGQIPVSNISYASSFDMISATISRNQEQLVISVSDGSSLNSRRSFAMNTTSGQTSDVPMVNNESPVYFGIDGSLIFKNETTPSIHAINTDNGNVVGQIPGYIYGKKQLAQLSPNPASAEQAGRLFIGEEQPLSYFTQTGASIPVPTGCQALTLPIKLYETENYTATASFTPPNNSCISGLIDDGEQTNYVMGKAYDATTLLGQLFAVIPEANAPQVTILEQDTPPNPVDGSVEQWRGVD